MLLVCDIGNSNIVFGIYGADGALAASWRLTSRLNATVDEYWVTMGRLVEKDGNHTRVEAAIVSSVVPPLTQKVADVLLRLTGVEAMVVGPGLKTGLDIKYDDPREVGADRIVNSVAALSRYEPPVIAVDFGTATTFDVILAPNHYLGGVIVPGLLISLDALVSRTAKLPKVDLRGTERVVGRNTAESIRSGLYNGTGALVDGLIERICAEHGIEPVVIATGGFAELIASACQRIQHIEQDLTLWGLREIWLKNR